jgi:hypothetical protein
MAFWSFPMNTARIDGDLKNRMDAMIGWELHGRTAACGFDDRWMINDVEHSLPAPRPNEDFTGDVWGAYIETMAALSRITGKRYPQVDRIVRKVTEYQRPDGSFWNVVPEDKDIPLVVADNRTWGWQRALIGLVEHYRTVQDERTLQSAKRLGDLLLRLYDKSQTVPPDTSLARTMRGSSLYPPSSYWSAVTQGFVRLYQITKEKKYLDTAVKIADRVPDQLLDVENTTDWLAWHGVMLLYEETGEQKYLEKIKKNVRSVMNMMTALGDTPHLWHFPKSNEACGLADSITVNCDLWRTTLDPAYMDAVERVTYNAFFAGQYPHTGCSRYNYEHRVMQSRHADPSEETGIRDSFVNVYKTGCESCCDWHVPLAYQDIAGHLFWKGKSPDIYVNLFFPSQAEFPSEKTAVRLEMETDYPHDGSVRLKIETDSPTQFPLHIRIPCWAEKASITINDGSSLPAPAGKYLTLDRVWNRDTLRLELPLSIRREAADPPWGRKPENPEDRIVLLKGPMIMVLDKDNNPDLAGIWNDPYIAGIRPSLVIPESGVSLVPEKDTPSSGNRSFRYPKSHYAGIWEISPGQMQVKGHLTPFMEVTGEEKPSFVQYVFRVKSISPGQYQEYAGLAGDDSFRYTEKYRQFLMKMESPSERTALLTDFLAGEKKSYDSVLAAHRLGNAADPGALDALAECLKKNNSILLQRTAILSIRKLGLMDEKIKKNLNELAEKVPELHSLIAQTLPQQGSVFHIGKEKTKNMSWIDGPDNTGEYLIRKKFDVPCPDIEKMDLRICSWDIYEVFWNGKITGVKPTWANAKFIDLTPLVQTGTNDLQVRVIRRGKLPDEFIQTWTVGYATIPPGIIMKLTVNYRNGDPEIYYTDDTWEAMTKDKPAWVPVTARIHKGGNPFSYGYAGD